MIRVFMLILLGFWLTCGQADAQSMAADDDAMYLAVVKAVSAYKINDEENIRGVERLRQDRRFNENLQKMLDKLSNSRSKDSKNRKVLKILEQAGKDIYETLR